MIWLIRALAWRLRGRWLRRRMRRQPPPCERCGLTYCIGLLCPLDLPPTAPLPIVVMAHASPDPHTAVLRMHFATGETAPGKGRALLYHEYARIARAVRSEHEPAGTGEIV